MGMAASQARFLGLTARMNNIEYEGQQINQQRTALSNKSASYYSDLLGMSVPTAPSVEQYTQTVYTFNDGALTNQITSLIADPDNVGTYKVSYIKNWTDDFAIVAAAPSIITEISAGSVYKIGDTKLRTLGQIAGGTSVGSSISLDGTTYTVNNDSGGYYINKSEKVPGVATCNSTDIGNFNYALMSSDYTYAEHLYKDTATGNFYTLDSDGNKVVQTGVNESSPNVLIYLFDMSEPDPEYATSIVTPNADGSYTKEIWTETPVKKYLTQSQVNSITTYAGAADDPYLSSLSADQIANLITEEQAYLELLHQTHGNTDNYFVRYVQNTSTGEYEPIFYNQKEVTGAIYDSRNNSQSYIPAYKIGSAERVEEIKGVENCAIEQDSTGRYINIKIGDKTYALTTNTITDQDAYEDAMNQYEYDKALYDQSIEEINAKIEIIQAEDKNLELRLKQLDTEHNAVSNEKSAVEKVIQKAVEGGFKTFG